VDGPTDGPKGGTTATFVVECYWPGIDEAQVRDVLTRVTQPRPGTAASRRAVRSLGCILVPSDGLALFLFEGPSAALVDEEGVSVTIEPSAPLWRPVC